MKKAVNAGVAKPSPFFTVVLVAMLFVPLVAPIAVNAQTYQDGSGESWAERRERVREYRRQSSENQAKIAALGTTAVVSVPMPVLFGITLKDIFPNFGDPRSGGRLHEGEDIMARSGTPIVSPTPAVVIRLGTGPSEGHYVYTANPGGETFVYMHLDRIGEGLTQGTVLPKGGLIGYVGNTGNAIGGAAHLHFEIHDSNDTPVDPFPRLSAEFSLPEKISYLSTILAQTTNPQALAEFLVTHFRGTFIGAIATGVALPAPIASALSAIPAGTTSTDTRTTLPAGELDVGSSGTLVVALQKYLIATNVGAFAKRLGEAGATGYFGPITKAALAEFQASVGITPANGYYGAATKTYIDTHPLMTGQPLPPVVTTPASSSPILRNLSLGMTGEDVRKLQKILNEYGYTVALSGAGSLGNETIYFGPATRSAVIKFQIARSITPAVGYVGPLTRSALGNI